MTDPKDGWNSGVSRVPTGHLDTAGNFVDDRIQPHNRYIQTAGNVIASDVATATWAEAEGVYRFRIRATATTSGNVLRFVLDASPVGDSTDTTQAETWLAAASASGSTDVEYFEVTSGARLTAEVDPVSVDEWSEWYELASPLRRLDCVAVTVDEAIDVLIEVA